jgi:outer membrane protein assembly factor BamA
MVTAPALPSIDVAVRTGLAKFLIFVTACSLMAAENGKPVTSLRLVPEERYLAPFDAQEATKAITIGKPLDPENVRQLIKDLYSTGRFLNVSVEAEPASEGVALVVRVDPAYFVRNVNVIGVPDPPSPGQLQNATKFQLGERFYGAQARQAVENILETLRSNGFYKAKVDAQLVLLP